MIMTRFQGAKAFGALCTLALALGIAGQVLALEWQTMESQTFGLEFDLPTSMNEVENTEELFLATGSHSDFTFMIVPFKDASVDSDKALELAVEALGELEITSVDSFEKADFKGNGEGYVLLGKALDNDSGMELYIGVMGLINKNNDKNALIYTFFSGDANMGVEEKIIKSIKMLGE
jgi:hypothetical protein